MVLWCVIVHFLYSDCSCVFFKQMNQTLLFSVSLNHSGHTWRMDLALHMYDMDLGYGSRGKSEVRLLKRVMSFSFLFFWNLLQPLLTQVSRPVIIKHWSVTYGALWIIQNKITDHINTFKANGMFLTSLFICTPEAALDASELDLRKRCVSQQRWLCSWAHSGVRCMTVDEKRQRCGDPGVRGEEETMVLLPGGFCVLLRKV